MVNEVDSQAASRTTAPGVAQIAAGVAIGLIAVIVVVWLVYGIVTANDDLDCSIENANRSMSGMPTKVC